VSFGFCTIFRSCICGLWFVVCQVKPRLCGRSRAKLTQSARFRAFAIQLKNPDDPRPPYQTMPGDSVSLMGSFILNHFPTHNPANCSCIPFFSLTWTNCTMYGQQRPLQARYKDILEDRSYLNKVSQKGHVCLVASTQSRCWHFIHYWHKLAARMPFLHCHMDLLLCIVCRWWRPGEGPDQCTMALVERAHWMCCLSSSCHALQRFFCQLHFDDNAIFLFYARYIFKLIGGGCLANERW